MRLAGFLARFLNVLHGIIIAYGRRVARRYQLGFATLETRDCPTMDMIGSYPTITLDVPTISGGNLTVTGTVSDADEDLAGYTVTLTGGVSGSAGVAADLSFTFTGGYGLGSICAAVTDGTQQTSFAWVDNYYGTYLAAVDAADTAFNGATDAAVTAYINAGNAAVNTATSTASAAYQVYSNGVVADYNTYLSAQASAVAPLPATSPAPSTSAASSPTPTTASRTSASSSTTGRRGCKKVLWAQFDDRKARDELYRRFDRRLRRLAFKPAARANFSRQGVEDAVQEMFHWLAEAIAGYDPSQGARFATFLHTVARRSLWNFTRNLLLQQSRNFPLPDCDLAETPTDEIAQERSRRLDEELAQLTDEDRPLWEGRKAGKTWMQLAEEQHVCYKTILRNKDEFEGRLRAKLEPSE